MKPLLVCSWFWFSLSDILNFPNINNWLVTSKTNTNKERPSPHTASQEPLFTAPRVPAFFEQEVVFFTDVLEGGGIHVIRQF